MIGENSSDRDVQGWLNALVAFGWWGFIFPMVIVWAEHAAAGYIDNKVRWVLEVLGLRIIFCLLFCLGLLGVTGKLKLLLDVFRSRKLVLWFALTAFLIFLNWFGFIIGVATDNLSQASLGYYMGPLFNVLLGYLFLSEKLRRTQLIAVIVAGLGVLWLTYKAGEFPWISLCLATSFGFYGLARKKTAVDSVVGMSMECIFCLPLCIGIIVYFANQPAGLVFLKGPDLLRWIFVFMGPATAIPLICFAIAARRLRLGTLGFIQFIAPTGQFVLSLFFDDKPFHVEKLIGYSFVWLAVTLYLFDLWANQKKSRASKG